MEDKINKIKANALELAATSRLERRINLKRFQDSKPLDKNKKTLPEERRFKVSDFNQVESEAGTKYLIKTSLNSGTLRKGDTVIGATKEGKAVIFGSPAGEPFLRDEKKKEPPPEQVALSVEVEIGFK